MLTPIESAGQGLQRARLEILSPTVPDPIIPLCFNPTEYQLQKSNNFAEIAIPGLESPPIQFVRGNCEKLTADVMVDTSGTLEDVREKYVNKIRGLLDINSELHAPPIVRFVWGSQKFKDKEEFKEEFKGVIESLNITYTLFTPEGVPLRAKLSLALKEYRPVEIQVKSRPKTSPDLEKNWVVRRGDTLSSIAAAVYRDPGVWREIARANQIQDPRTLAPGLVLTLPRLR
ncbi:MAG: LysM peptidoglycan-binding domain-containing protein [Acidobacteria bacterium]|nr:LysM peptidoglycan-binding domain-containing protein [Acidobacteriota bacterium]